MVSSIKNQKNNNKIHHIKTEQIYNDLWDARIKPEYDTESSFLYLKQNIKTNGLFNPIHITPKTNKKGTTYYSIVDGRRRFEAMKQLGYKQIECFVLEGKSQQEISAITLIQNLHRKNLNDVERSIGIAAVFEKVGFSVNDVITNCKRIHNEGSKNVDPVFVQVLESIGYSANFTYQLMQLLKDLPTRVFTYSQKKGLSTQQKILLTHTKLREHPEIQRWLVDQIKGQEIKASRIIVYQAIRDLETGALFKDGKSYAVNDYLRDKIPEGEGGIEYAKTQNYFEILKHSNELLRFLTGHQLTKGEYEYNKDHINYSAQHRLEILRSLDSRTIMALLEQIQILHYALDSMESLISGEVNQKFE
jgi:hypothetical protein